MPEGVEIDTENQLVRANFGSGSTVENWKKVLIEVERISAETGLRRVLVDVREQTDLASTMTLFDFGVRLPRSIAFAVLCKTDLDEHRFIEDVARNRGIAVKDFASEQDAIMWLKEWPNRGVSGE